MDPFTILAALGPLAVDLGKSLIGRFVQKDSYKPVNVDEYVKMRQFDLDMFKALNDAGGANPSYPWVEAIVQDNVAPYPRTQVFAGTDSTDVILYVPGGISNAFPDAGQSGGRRTRVTCGIHRIVTCRAYRQRYWGCSHDGTGEIA